MTKLSSFVLNAIDGLNQEEKKKALLQNFLFLSRKLESIFGMNNPWLLIIDNQILIDLEYNQFKKDNRERYIRLIAIFMIFNFLLDYSEKRIKIVLTPCVFYEFNKRKVPENPNNFNSSLGSCLFLLKTLGAKELLSFGLDDYKVTRSTLKNIAHDEKEIIKLVQKLKRKEMNFELYQKLSWDKESDKKGKIEMFTPPFIIASQIVASQKIKLRYFDRNIVNHIIACHLENKVYSDSVQTKIQKTQIKNSRNDSMNKTVSLSKIENEKLKGLADIEMIQYCNILSQFSHALDHTLYPLTFDKALAHLLEEKTRIRVRTGASQLCDE